MVNINLRDLFPEYELDCYIEVPDSDAEAFAAAITGAEAAVYFQFARAEAAYLRRLFRNKAHYSLDVGDGIENAALVTSSDPAAIYEDKQAVEQLYAAINSLPDKQAKRIYAHYILGMSKAEIARIEGVRNMSVANSITHGLQNLKKYFLKQTLLLP